MEFNPEFTKEIEFAVEKFKLLNDEALLFQLLLEKSFIYGKIEGSAEMSKVFKGR